MFVDQNKWSLLKFYTVLYLKQQQQQIIKTLNVKFKKV